MPTQTNPDSNPHPSRGNANSPHDPDDARSAPRVCVVVSRYNHSVTHAMRDAAIAAYRARFGPDATPSVVEAPGAFELTALATAAIETGVYDGVVALGCIIKGETDHDRYIAQAVASGLTTLTIQTGIPAAFGVLTTNTPEQAIARAGGSDGATGSNKGTEAMDALLDTIEGIRHLYDAAAGNTPADFAIARASADKATTNRSTNQTSGPAAGAHAANPGSS